MLETAIKALSLTETGRAISKIEGHRNWTIRMEMNDKIAYVSGFGVMQRRWLLSERLDYMAKHGTCWAHYTYKKDFLQAVKALEENGFEIHWLR